MQTYNSITWQAENGLEYDLEINGNVISIQAQALPKTKFCKDCGIEAVKIFEALYEMILKGDGGKKDFTKYIRNKLINELDNPIYL